VKLSFRFFYLLLAVAMAGSMWWYVQRILVRYQIGDAAAHDRPRGNLSDLYPRWLGARELLLHGRDPYGDEVTREIQLGYYGRVLDPNRTSDPKDQQRFAYPLYVVFLLAPVINLPFATVQHIYFGLILALTAASVLFWIRALRWRPHWLTTATIMVLLLGSFSAVQAIKLQQLTLLVSSMTAAAVALLVSGHLAIAGILFAFLTIKPQLTLLLIGWLTLWTFADWQKRRRFLQSFLLTMAVLLVASQLLLPGWIPSFIQGLAAYRQYTGGASSCLDVLLTPLVGKFVAIGLLFILAVFCWRERHEPAASSRFIFTAALVLAMTVVLVPMVAPYNQLLLLPSILLVVSDFTFPYTADRLAKMLSTVAFVAIGWQWAGAFSLVIALYLLPQQTVLGAWTVPLYSSFAIPLAVLAMLIPHVLRQLRSDKAPVGSSRVV